MSIPRMKKAGVFLFEAGNIFLLANGLAFFIRRIGFSKDKLPKYCYNFRVNI